MFDVTAWSNILAYVFIVSGTVITILVLNGMRCGVTIGAKGIAMRVINKEENKRSFWINSILALLVGIGTIILGIFLYL